MISTRFPWRPSGAGESIDTPSNYPPAVGRFRPEQIATRSTWNVVPDDQARTAAMHAVHIVPANGSTVTEVNPLDPGTTEDADPALWLERPHGYGYVTKPGKRL